MEHPVVLYSVYGRYILKRHLKFFKYCLHIVLTWYFQKRVKDTFPNPIDDWAVGVAQDALKKSKSRRKSALVLPFDKVHSLLKEVLHSNKLDDQVSLYLVAVLDYIAGDILKVCNHRVSILNQNKHTKILSLLICYCFKN